MIYFDQNHEAYTQLETLQKWGKVLVYECNKEEYQNFLEGKLIWENNKLVDNPEYETKELEKAKQAKIAENEIARNVEYISTSLGRLKTQTPLGDLKTALPLYDKIAAANGGLPQGAVRLYDTEGNVSLSPALSLEQYQALTVEVAMVYVSIDAKSTQYTQAILNSKTLEELNEIVIDYTSLRPLEGQEPESVESPV